MKIFCIGLSRTGTSTFASIMQSLGFKHHGNHGHLNRIRESNINEVFNFIDTKGFQSFDDHPWSDLWKELYEKYPNAKFVNLIRDPIAWRKSLMKMASNTVKNAEEIKNKAAWRIQFFQDYLDDPTGKWFIERNDQIKKYFKGNDKFIELDWRYNNYEDLCKFLDIKSKNMNMPHMDCFPKFNKQGLENILEYFNIDEKQKIKEIIK